jgi:hypothetical protein
MPAKYHGGAAATLPISVTKRYMGRETPQETLPYRPPHAA